MKISAQEEYGVRCLLRLAQTEEQSLTLPEIAQAEGLSVAYVAKLMAVLRQAGLIDSVRGRSGGYRLVRAPAQIGLGSLLLILGEPLYDEQDYCQKHAGIAEDGRCVHKGACSLRTLWQTLEHWMRGTLDQVTLADLLTNEGQLTDLLRARLAATMFKESPNLTPLTTVSV